MSSDVTKAKIEAVVQKLRKQGRGMIREPLPEGMGAAHAASAKPREITYNDPCARPAPPPVRSWPVTAGPSDLDKIAPPLRKAIKSAIEAQQWPIYIFGPVGTGKTCAMACVYMRWTGPALWRECSRIVSDVIECRTNETGTITRSQGDTTCQEGEQAIIRKVRDTSLLLLNDVGIRKPSEAAYEILLGIIDLRIGRPLIVTANLDPDQLAKVFDDRIASRLLRGAVIHCVGDDRRAAGHKFVRVRAGKL